MLETSVLTTCKWCGAPVEQKGGRGHRQRAFCSTAHKQKYVRTMHKQKYEARIQQLEQVVKEKDERIADLEQQLHLDLRYRRDTHKRNIKAWMRTHLQPRDVPFYKQFLEDTRMPREASHAKYEQTMKLYHCSEDDLHLFRELWKTMLLSQP